ncbi:MAG: helix-turn-helix domain-containing protein [Chitinivibrionales bacterium]|nr:helix-turn-helix domain-containing protein [Chitinivibrionales bacterium]
MNLPQQSIRSPFVHRGTLSLLLLFHLAADIAPLQGQEQNTTPAPAPQALEQLCCNFVQPSPWIPQRTNLCTLAITPIFPIKAATFKVRYLPENESIPIEVPLGTLTKPPFKLVWDISTIPNQVTYGVTCFVDVVRENNKLETLQRQGIFLTHQRYSPPQCTISYGRNRLAIKKLSHIPLQCPTNSGEGKAAVWWNEKGLYFHITVTNPLFYTSLPSTKLDQIGVKIYTDSKNKKTPYLTDDITIIIVPLPPMQPYQLVATSVYKPNGSFELRHSQTSPAIYSRVTTESFKGYTIECMIPMKKLGSIKKPMIGCNIIATAIDENSAISELSWVKGGPFFTISPFSYGTLYFGSKPFFANAAVQWISFFIIGCVLALLAFLIKKLFKPKRHRVPFEKDQNSAHMVHLIEAIVEVDMINPSFSIKEISQKLQTKPTEINKLILKSHGKNFDHYVCLRRVELAKERLRSTHATEKAVAQTSGFSSAEEMEEAFKKFERLTPFSYRKSNHLA